MKLTLFDKNSKQNEYDIEIILVLNKDLEAKNIKDRALLKNLNFKGGDEEAVFLPESQRIYVGCEENSYECIAIAIATAVKKFQTTQFKTACVELLEDESESLKALVEGAILGAYTFKKYKSKKEKEVKQELVLLASKDLKKLSDIFNESVIIAESVNKTRDFVNTTPDDFYPKIMAKEAKKIAKENDLEIEVYGQKYLQKNKMNAMYSVGRASRHESKLIHLSYKPNNPKKKIVLIGKGLTYDSGGLSLKPSDFMVTMKSDKSGGCAVLGMLNAIAKLKLPIEVHGIVGAVENMIGGDAYKPDDVLKARNGKTIEIRNTDAEGRLVLADCLCYAQDTIKDIDYIFDYATLTGASVVGVGEYTTSIMGNNSKLKYKAVSSALQAGEYATSLPFNRFLRKAIKSEIADVCNVANTRYGGAITAGLFLDNFVYDENKEKWLHFDIAGPAFVEKAWGYNPHGASGAGIRMTIELLKAL
ncbi:leucyl aminopeptidase [Candidatus Marinarcus aquaticus]|uniref:Probable cytosol aminopeptidase n=1 Tax=Candidatus Marinarcus aquaticus TaxID=2044504 RepID=A0A4Q0XWM8_9BACT|nr:leucyl aminopeptidase [Candidatus Marinarcus aquaticus]RXJ60669.1 leucyl aminopeptidase [Candidatus Marinarcus aquaticus]